MILFSTENLEVICKYFVCKTAGYGAFSAPAGSAQLLAPVLPAPTFPHHQLPTHFEGAVRSRMPHLLQAASL